MKLTSKAITNIKTDIGLRALLSLELRTSDYTILKWLRENKPNNPLTTAGALKLIRKGTKLRDSQILEECSHQTAAANPY